MVWYDTVEVVWRIGRVLPQGVRSERSISKRGLICCSLMYWEIWGGMFKCWGDAAWNGRGFYSTCNTFVFLFLYSLIVYVFGLFVYDAWYVRMLVESMSSWVLVCCVGMLVCLYACMFVCLCCFFMCLSIRCLYVCMCLHICMCVCLYNCCLYGCLFALFGIACACIIL